MNFNRIGKLNNLVSNDLKRKPTIILDPNPEQSYRMFGTANDIVIGMEPIADRKVGTLLAITENGFGKRTELEEYRVQTRGGKGVITYTITPKTGDIVGIKIANEEEDVMMITDKGTVIRIKSKEISVLGRNTQGVTLMRTNDGGKVVSIETISEETEDVESDK